MQHLPTRGSPGGRSLFRLAALIGILALVGCSVTTAPPKPHILGIIGGDQQAAMPAGTDFPTPLTVIVIDQYGFASANVTVTWAVTSGGGSVSAASTQTDDNGTASVTFTAGPVAGSATIDATVTSIGTVTFHETSTA
jgi:hypothetical protein